MMLVKPMPMTLLRAMSVLMLVAFRQQERHGGHGPLEREGDARHTSAWEAGLLPLGETNTAHA
jgi:hypothetical protein